MRVKTKEHERQRCESENRGAREIEKQERQRSERDRGARETQVGMSQ